MLLYELSSPQKYTPWHVIQNARYNSFKPYHSIAIRFQDLLTPFQGFFSTFPHGTMLYRFLNVFKVGSWCLPNSRSVSSERYSRYYQILFDSSTGLSPSMIFHSRKVWVSKLGRKDSLITPHLLYITIKDSVCLNPFSVAPTNGISIDFFSCRY